MVRRRKTRLQAIRSDQEPNPLPAVVPALSKSKKILYSCLASIVIPVTILLLAETALRVAGYGKDMHVFSKQMCGNTAYYVRNGDYLHKTFHLYKTLGMIRFPVEKPSGTFRVFVLGESAAMGTPDPACSIGRYLEAMLSDKVLDKKIELNIVSCAAISSHVVRAIALACAGCQPDLFVVYMGNNEVVGPFGPGTVFGGSLPSLTLIRTQIWARSLRLGQLIERGLQFAFPARASLQQYVAMELFTQNQICEDDQRLEHTYAYFTRNLKDIVEAGLNSGAMVVVSTLGCNLKDFAPLGSLHPPALPDSEAAECEKSIEEGKDALGQGDSEGAVKALKAAIAIDDKYAEAWFHFGRALLMRQQYDAARNAFARARDLDTLRFRADSRINEAIRTVARQYEPRRVILVDGERSLDACGLVPIAGEEAFFEHVHFTPAGTYQLARAMYEALVPHLRDRLPLAKDLSVPSQERCEERLCIGPADYRAELKYFSYTVSRPPFTNQFGRRERLDKLRKQLLDTSIYATRLKQADRQEVLRRALELHPDDYWIEYRYADALQSLGVFPQAEDLFVKFLCVSDYPEIRAELGLTYLAQNKSQEALDQFRVCEKQYPGDAWALWLLGLAYGSMARLEEAERLFRESIRLDPLEPAVYSDLGALLTDKKAFDDAERVLSHAIEIHPEYSDYYSKLDHVLETAGNPARRSKTWDALTQRFPESAEAAYYFGLSLKGTDDLDGAMAAYRDCLARDPYFVQAYLEMGLVCEKRNDLKGAIEYCEKILALDPNHYYAHNNLGYYLSLQRKEHEAIEEYKKAIRLDPETVTALQNLADVMATTGNPSGAIATWQALAQEFGRFSYGPLLYLGRALEALTDFEGARSAYVRALELNPQFKPAQEALTLLSKTGHAASSQ